MQFKNLYVKNFQSIGEIKFKFPDGLILIDGWNEDQQSHNGAGKSALLNSITYAIYGNTPKRVKLQSELVRDGSKESFTDISLEAKGRDIRIVRTRSNKSSGSLDIYVNGEKLEGLIKKLEEVIPNLIGLSFNQFIQVIYIFQNADNRFITMNDTAKKQFLSTLLGLEIYDKAYRSAHKSLTDLELVISKDTGSIESMKSQLDKTVNIIEELQLEIKNFSNNKDIQINHLTKQAKIKKKKLIDLEQAKIKADNSEKLQILIQKKMTIQQQIEGLKKIKDNIQNLKNKMQWEERNIEFLQLEIKKFEEGGNCPTCSQPLPNWNVDDKIKSNEEKIVRHQLEINNLKSKRYKYELLIQENELKINVAAENILQKIAEEKANGPDKFNTQIDLKKQEIKNISNEMNSLEEKLELMNKQYSQYKKSCSDIEEHIVNLRDGILQSEKRKKYLIEIKKIFSPTGVKAFVFSNIINDLNDKIAEYLGILSDGAINFKIDSDDTKGKFTEICEYNGTSRSLATLSGGEFRRLLLAGDFALANVVSNRTSIYPNILFIDEGFDGLDDTGRLKVMSLLQDMINTKDAIYVVDHASEFKASFGNVFHLVKRNGKTIHEGD